MNVDVFDKINPITIHIVEFAENYFVQRTTVFVYNTVECFIGQFDDTPCYRYFSTKYKKPRSSYTVTGFKIFQYSKKKLTTDI